MVESKNLFKTLKELVEDIFKKIYVKPFGLYVVSGIDATTYTANIKNIHFPMLQYDDVNISGNGIGNFKGIVNMPAVDDMVLVAFIDKNTPIIIGNLFSNLVTSTGKGKDTVPAINGDDLLLMNKKSGANLRLHGSNGVTINKGTNPVARVGDQISVAVTWTDGPGSGTFVGTIIEGNENVLID